LFLAYVRLVEAISGVRPKDEKPARGPARVVCEKQSFEQQTLRLLRLGKWLK
jgi:hypothetical protein